MKTRKSRKKRISDQIVRKSTSVVAVIFVIVAAVTLGIILAMTISSNETELTLESQSASYQLEDYFDQYTTVTDQMAVNPQIKKLLADTQKGQAITEKDGYATVFENMVNIAGIDSNILAAWIGDLDASILTQSDGYTSPEDWDITQRPWYEAAQDKKTMLTEPYVDASTGKLIISAASPIIGEDGSAIGVAGLDISIEKIEEILGSRKIGDEGYLMMFSSNGMTIYHPNEDNIQKNVSELDCSENIEEAVLSGESQFLKYEAGGDTRYGYVSPVGDTGLIVVSALPGTEYFYTLNLVIALFIVIFAAGITIVIVAMKKVAVSIAKPVMELNDTAQKLAAGDLDVTINVKSEDEIGELGHSIQATVNRLKEYINYIDEISEVLDRLASGKLAIQLKYDYVGEFQKVKVALQNISSSMTEVMTGIRTSAMQVSTGADDLSLASQGLAEGSQNQAAAVEELVATSAAVMEQVEQNKQEAEQSAGRTQEVANMMAESESRMNEMLKAMKTIEETSGQVVGVIQAIEEIATQTNLLALNASIEAARAGEAGKGFAVVAGEIGGLADESAKAVNTTRELIGISMDEIKRGMKLVEEVGESIRTSAEAVVEVNGMIKKTTENAVYQAQNMEQINQGVEDISNAVQDNSAMAEESSATSEELASQATLLNSLVQRFEME